MRTVKRQTLDLNCNKEESLRNLCRAYTREKRYWVDTLKGWKFQAFLSKPRLIRDQFVQMKYVSPFGLQARHWKLALQDAVEIWDKYWQAIFIQIKPRIYKTFICEKKRRYAFWLLKDYPQFAQLMTGKKPKPSFDIEEAERDRVASFLQKTIKKLGMKKPSIQKARTIKFDANCYDSFEHCGRQYIKVMSLERGKRIVIPLKGKAKLQGNLTLVLQKNIEIHLCQNLTPKIKLKGAFEAVDFGYTEVMTDTHGNQYGKNLGKILTKASNEQHEKMKKRHKIHALEKKYRVDNPAKAKKIRKFNLGRQKLNAKTKKIRQTVEIEINTAIHDLIKNKTPEILVTENLRHSFTLNNPKSLNRKLSRWVKGKIQDRVEFKALAKGFRHEPVNPAYGSQICLHCDFVDKKNRNQDKFKCLYCGYEDIADRVAALNYARRYEDKKIGLYMPYNQVKTILLERFHRRLETGKPVTVPGRTLETVTWVDPPPKSRNQSREKTSFL